MKRLEESSVVTSFAQKMAECPKPQMVGYLLEYLVSFALVRFSNLPCQRKEVISGRIMHRDMTVACYLAILAINLPFISLRILLCEVKDPTILYQNTQVSRLNVSFGDFVGLSSKDSRF